MKKFFSLMFAVCGLLLLVGCSDSPKDVVIKWAEAIKEGNAEEANEYSTERTHAVNAIFIAMVKKGDKQETVDVEKIDNAREEIDGNTAKVYVDKDNPVTLKKVDGDWKVDVEK